MKIRIIVKKVLDAFFHIYCNVYVRGADKQRHGWRGAVSAWPHMADLSQAVFAEGLDTQVYGKAGRFYPDINGAFKYRDFICVPCRSKE